MYDSHPRQDITPHVNGTGSKLNYIQQRQTNHVILPGIANILGSPLSAKRFLDAELETRFKEKPVEFETVNRTYCSNPECSIFMPPADIDSDTVVCPSCSEGTCVTCKAPAHRGECPADLELTSVLKLAQGMRWQRCYNCLRAGYVSEWYPSCLSHRRESKPVPKHILITSYIAICQEAYTAQEIDIPDLEGGVHLHER
jgi:hypothetical protein